MEFDGSIPAGTEFHGEIPAINHNFTYTFPSSCGDNRAFWFQLPENYPPGADVILRTHLTNVTVNRSHADGLVVIANIDAQEDFDHVAISITIIEDVLFAPEDGTPPTKNPGIKIQDKVETSNPETKR
jgi:hypothetical protein